MTKELELDGNRPWWAERWTLAHNGAVHEAGQSTLARLNLPKRHKKSVIRWKFQTRRLPGPGAIFLKEIATFSCINLSPAKKSLMAVVRCCQCLLQYLDNFIQIRAVSWSSFIYSCLLTMIIMYNWIVLWNLKIKLLKQCLSVERNEEKITHSLTCFNMFCSVYQVYY